MKEELLKLLQYRTAEGATGPSALRNQGNRGVLAAARHFLKAIDLFEFSVTSEQKFKSVLDDHTNHLTLSFPEGARHWGAARKALNLFLRDVLGHHLSTPEFQYPLVDKPRNCRINSSTFFEKHCCNPLIVECAISDQDWCCLRL